MNAQLEMIPGTTRDLTLSQHFTHPELAQRVVEWAGVKRTVPNDREWLQNNRVFDRPMRVLEPSAGNGALVRPLVAAGAEVHAIEIDERYREPLRALVGTETIGNLFICDFLQQFSSDNRAYDLCVMNPPYENGMDVAFILHALRFAPRVVGIYRADLFYGVERCDSLWSQVRPTRAMLLKRRWFKNPQTGKGGETNYVVLDLVRIAASDKPNRVTQCTIEWW